MSVSTVGLEETVGMLSPCCSFTGHIYTDIWESESLVCCLYKYGISHRRLITTLFARS